MYPPVFECASTQSIAARISSFCKWLNLFTSALVFWTLIAGSRAITPRPVHGASRRTLSNLVNIFGSFLPSWFETTTLFIPSLWQFALRLFRRSFLTSFATRIPVFFINYAMYEVLPPGAAAMSKILSFAWGARVITGKKELGLYKI